MKKEDLDKILDSISEKVGDEVKGTIASDIGSLITLNNQVIEELHNKEERISKLEDTNEKLIKSNGALLQQIPHLDENSFKKESSRESHDNYFDYRSTFDENGNII